MGEYMASGEVEKGARLRAGARCAGRSRATNSAQLLRASGTGMPSVVSTSAAFVLTAVPFVIASISLPPLADSVAAVHCCVISSRSDFADANLSAVRVAGGFFLLGRV